MTDADQPRRLMTKAQFAREEYQKISGRACSKEYLSKPDIVELLAPAMHPDPSDPTKQLLDADAALDILKKSADADRQFIGEDPAGPDDDADEEDAPRRDKELYATKKRRAAIQLQKEEMELATMLGRLLDREEASAAVAASYNKLRERMKERNPRLAEELAGMTSVREIVLFLDSEDRALQENFVNELRKKGLEPRIDDAGGEPPAA